MGSSGACAPAESCLNPPKSEGQDWLQENPFLSTSRRSDGRRGAAGRLTGCWGESLAVLGRGLLKARESRSGLATGSRLRELSRLPGACDSSRSWSATRWISRSLPRVLSQSRKTCVS